jgi:integrase
MLTLRWANLGCRAVALLLNDSARFWSNLDMRRPTLKVHKYKHSKTHKFYINLRAFGKGRKFFRTRAEAEAAALREKTLLERHGREAVALSQREMSEFITARKKLAEYGEMIMDAVNFRVNYLQRVRRHGITVAQLADEIIQAKRKDGRSAVYLRDLRYRLSRFVQDFGNRAIAGITVDELDGWLRALPFSPQARTNYRTIVGLLFNHAESRGILDFNPIRRTMKPKLVDKAPEIFIVDELRALLETAQRTEPSVLPMLAIGAFAGLRDAEIKRLDWSEVDLARGHVEVKAAKAKSARRRIVPIQPNLMEWLRPYSEMTGQLVPVAARGKIERVRKAAGLTRWPINGLRHSFASYRLALIHDAPRVAAELGHTTPQLLYSAYRELVVPAEAERYWKIGPVSAMNVIPLRQTEAV